MATAPYGVRLMVGVAATAVEETMKLPQTILTYPMTLVSQVAHLVMKVQQDVADLVNKGDETLGTFFPPKDEQPEWATFDDEVTDTTPEPGGERRTDGRFALYSIGEDDEPPVQPPPVTEPEPAPGAPAVVADIDYTALTLAQLRARLQSLSVEDLEALLAYEESTKARAPFQTLLANRITRASAK
ncbi:lipid droplet-associated protein [Mycolicibacterium mengxianglii]|uniref:lipid droplet-associated protein n=1 Tax=Mycolicibacterium mengxianglii TaxID=2736649 RepID=UPI0018EEE9BB|nr:lipid droplet-associated protein [Mycolicibacterium mengxianglii]